ncbi:hypothetical protein BCV70DRAFT_199999 [Testicularia cyperi]|uniref:Uncharacterized protein n=1 Tax=Testicularia cyperi TaxID=1882483 RepID=A0A317XR10_9BASI|nr:hypothetical protein BCV70DRAFT_199999 [Testicularia cyperi]
MSSGYELHQKLRTKTVRQVKKKQYDEAIQSLYDGAVQLLDQKEQGSGCDLGIYMLDVYGMKHQAVDSESRDRVTDLIGRAAPDFWRKKLVDAAIKWTVDAAKESADAAASTSTAGDPLLRLYIAKLLAKESNFHGAESHFLASCIPIPYAVESAPKSFAEMMGDWLAAHAQESAQRDGETRDANALERIEAGRFAMRGAVPLLANQAHQQAATFLQKYIDVVTARQKSLLLPVKPNPKPYVTPGAPSAAPNAWPNVPEAVNSTTLLYLTANADLNFAQMVTALVQDSVKLRTSPGSNGRTPDWLKNSWTQVIRQGEREAPSLQLDDGIRQSISMISSVYFDIAPPRAQNNMLSDMMASLFGGPPAGSQSTAAKQIKPTAPGLAPPSAAVPPTSTSASTSTQQAPPPANTADDLVDDEMD